jgi:hypothetical protein
MNEALAAAFEEWDRRYRENPEGFMTEVEHLLGHTPRSYGELAATYLVALLNELAGGLPWNTIVRTPA